MNQREDKPVRRLRAVRSHAQEQAAGQLRRETAETVLPGSPRVGALDALLREVDGLRLTLETDLSLAAAAVEAGAPGIAADIIDGDRDGLQAFESRALGHLADLAGQHTDPAARRRWWSHVPAAPFVAAAAMVGFLVGVVPQTLGSAPDEVQTAPASASQSLAQLTELAANGETGEVRDAATALHSQLMALIAQAGTNPDAARQGLLMLSAERAVIAESGDSQALGDVLAASNRLSDLILQALPASVRTTASKPKVKVLVVATRAPSSQATPKPSVSPSAKSTPKPSSSPTPSSSPSDPGVLPTDAPVHP